MTHRSPQRWRPCSPSTWSGSFWRQLLARLPVPAAARHRPVRGPAGPAREPSRPRHAHRDRGRDGLDGAVPGRLGGVQRRRPAGVRRARHRHGPPRRGRARRHPGRLRRPRRPPARERPLLAVRPTSGACRCAPSTRSSPSSGPCRGRRRADVDRRVGRLPGTGTAGTAPASSSWCRSAMCRTGDRPRRPPDLAAPRHRSSVPSPAARRTATAPRLRVGRLVASGPF